MTKLHYVRYPTFCEKLWYSAVTATFWDYLLLVILYIAGKTIYATSVNDLGILLEIVQTWLSATTVDFLGEMIISIIISVEPFICVSRQWNLNLVLGGCILLINLLFMVEYLILYQILFCFSHIAAECNSTTMCWNCKEPGHLANQCPNDPVCHMCGKMGHLARDCYNPSLPAHDARPCNNCYKPGHTAADCTNEKACNNCRKTGHLARDCPNEPVCNICNISGHVARQCSKSSLASDVGGPFNDIICRNCGQHGHLSHECVAIVICNNCGGRGHQAFKCPSAPFYDRGPRRY